MMDTSGLEKFIDGFILFCLCVLVIFLPIAHTETIRAFALGIPGGLWGIKAILRRRLLFSRTPLDLPLLLFTIVAGFSVIIAVDWKYSLDEFIGEWVMGVFLFYLVVNNVRPEQMKYILAALLIGNMIMVGYGIYDFFRDGGQLLNYRFRTGSLHSGEGTFSTYLATVIPYVLIAVFFVQKTSHRLLLLILLSLNFLAVTLTYSRGSWVAIGALLLLAGIKFLPKKILIFSLAIFLVTIFLPATRGIPVYLYHRFTGPDVPVGSMDSINARGILTRFSLEKIRETPFRMLGFGQRSFVKKYESFYLRYKGAYFWHAHNTFLNIALQTGVQGLAIFCFLLYTLLRYCQKNEHLAESSVGKFYFSATFLMIVTFFVRNLSDDFFIDDSALLFWFLSGAALAIGEGSSGKQLDRLGS